MFKTNIFMNTKLLLCVKGIEDADCLFSSADARKLIRNFNNATAIELDFSGIEAIGDEFAHELFIVWRKENPESTIAVVKACESVETAISRVLKAR